jgi:hypothetical protein
MPDNSFGPRQGRPDGGGSDGNALAVSFRMARPPERLTIDRTGTRR